MPCSVTLLPMNRSAYNGNGLSIGSSPGPVMVTVCGPLNPVHQLVDE